MTTPPTTTPRLTWPERIAGTVVIILGFGVLHTLVYLLEGAQP